LRLRSPVKFSSTISADSGNSALLADYIAFSRAKGLYGGLNLEGSVISPADDWNNRFYGKATLPPDILVRGTAHSPAGEQLAADIGRAATAVRSSPRTVDCTPAKGRL
jgi:lipid-binding SYLF domain-containing protein